MAHLSWDELRTVLQAAEQAVPKWSIRFHRKAPDKKYIIRDIIIAEADDGVLIIYEATYESLHDIRLARPIHSFLEMVDTPSWERVQRFVRIV